MHSSPEDPVCHRARARQLNQVSTQPKQPLRVLLVVLVRMRLARPSKALRLLLARLTVVGLRARPMAAALKTKVASKFSRWPIPLVALVVVLAAQVAVLVAVSAAQVAAVLVAILAAVRVVRVAILMAAPVVQAAILVAAPVILAVVRAVRVVFLAAASVAILAVAWAVQVAAPVVVRVLLALAVLQAATAAVLRAVVLPTEVVLIAHLAKANLPPKASRVDLTLAGAASIAVALIRALSITVKVLLGAIAEVSRKAIEASHLANLLKEKMQEARIKNLLEVEIKADKNTSSGSSSDFSYNKNQQNNIKKVSDVNGSKDQ